MQYALRSLSLSKPAHRMIALLAIALSYATVAKLGLLVATLHASASPVWPASGLAITALVIFGWRFWPAIFCGALAANLLTSTPALSALPIAAGNSLEAICGAFLLRRVWQSKASLEHLRHATGIVVASILASAVSASIGGASLCWLGHAGWSDFQAIWQTWWVGDALGSLIVTPLLLALAQHPTLKAGALSLAKALLPALAAGLLVHALLVDESATPYFYLIFPTILLVGWVFDEVSVGLTTLAIALMCVMSTVGGHGPFAGETVNQGLINLQLFLGSFGTTALFLVGFKRAGSLRLPATVLLFAWTLCGMVFFSFTKNNIQQDDAHLSTLISESERALMQRMKAYIHSLESGVALFAASQTIERQEWHDFTRSLNIKERYPGVEGLGVIVPVGKGPAAAAFEETQRAHGVSDFTIHSVPGYPLTSALSEHYVITYIEPRAGNEPSLGLDIGTEGHRYEAAEKARRSGLPAITKKITLVQDDTKSPGFLLFLPVYKNGSQHPEDLQAWVYAPFVAAEFFEGVLGRYVHEIGLAVYQGPPSDAALLYRSHGPLAEDDPGYRSQRHSSILMGQMPLTLVWSARPGYKATSGTTAAWAGSLGALVSLLLVSLVVNLQAVHRKAEKLVGVRTAELELQSRTVRNMTEGIVVVRAADYVIVYCNPKFEAILGYGSGELQGKPIGLTTFADGGREPRIIADEIARTVAQNGEYTYDIKNVKKDGSVILCRVTTWHFEHPEHGLVYASVREDITARKRLESDRERLVSLVESSSDFICLAALDERVEFLNVAAHNILGLGTQGDFARFKLAMFLAADDRELMAATIMPTVLASGQWRGELRILNEHSGQVIPMQATIFKVHETQAVHADMLAIVAKDLREIKQVEAERTQFFSCTLDMLAIANFDGYFKQINPAFEEVLGYSSDELLSRPFMDFVHPDDLAKTKLELRLLTEGNKRISFENRYRCKDGTYKVLSWKSTPIGDLIYAAARDVTELQRTEESLRLGEARLAEAQRIAHIGSWSFDLVSKAFRWSAELYRIFGLTPDTRPLTAQDYLAVIHPDDIAILRHTYAGFTEAPREFETQYRVVRPDGAIRYCHMIGRSERDRQGRLVAIVGTCQDITERKRVDQLKDEFVSMVSHELRTPLTSIRGALALVAAGVAGELPTKAKAMIDIANSNSERLIRLINDILDIEKIEAGSMAFRMESLNVKELIEQALEANAGYAERFGVVFVSGEIEAGARVMGDSDRLMQVFANLLSNAAKFSPAGANIDISARSTSEHSVEFALKDHGPGVPEEFREKIFSKFAQADSSDDRQQGGSGLGLSISKAIVEKHGGRIWYESVKGEGTTFFFELPMVELALSKQERLLDGPQVLIVDDDADVGSLLSIYLKRAGYRCHLANTVEQAMGLLRSYAFAAVTIDLNLGAGESGLDLIANVKAAEEGRTPVPLIVVSGSSQMKALQRDAFLGAAVFAWIYKPIGEQELLAVMRRATLGSGSERARIFHIEYDRGVRLVVQGMLADRYEVVSANSPQEASAKLAAEKYDLVIAEVGINEPNALQLLTWIKESQAGAPIIIFSEQEPSTRVAESVAVVLIKTRASNDDLRREVDEQIAAGRGVHKVA